MQQQSAVVVQSATCHVVLHQAAVSRSHAGSDLLSYIAQPAGQRSWDMQHAMLALSEAVMRGDLIGDVACSRSEQ